jgi:hypothetical protein
MTVIFADTETLNAREGRAIGVEDKIRVRVLLVGKKATSPEAHGWHRRRTSPRRIVQIDCRGIGAGNHLSVAATAPVGSALRRMQLTLLG